MKSNKTVSNIVRKNLKSFAQNNLQIYKNEELKRGQAN
jgi:hypothetical protein